MEIKEVLYFTIDSLGNTALLYTGVNINPVKKLKGELVIIIIYLLINVNQSQCYMFYMHYLILFFLTVHDAKVNYLDENLYS